MRSKVLIVSTVLATIWAVLIGISLGNILFNGGIESIQYLNAVQDVLGSGSEVVEIITVFVVLACIHTVLFVLGVLLSWIAVFCKKKGPALASAILYLLATIICPIFILICLPMIILGFVGYSKQRNLTA